MHTTSTNPVRKVVGPFVVQALVWIGLTVAFAALLHAAGPQSWANALQFAALNWMPWAVLAPAVFWFSGRFPIERGHLWRSIPAHLGGCATCVTITVCVATYVGYGPRPTSPRFEERRALIEREARERDVADRPAPAERTPNPDRPAAADRSAVVGRADQPYTPPAFERNSRPERFRADARPPFGRRRPFWWPFLGTTLLRANFDAAVYLIVLVAAHALAFYRRAQERERHAAELAAGLNRAKLDALRLQLHPHFLFNTLNAISTLVHRDPAAADELIGDLSELLRLSLQTTDHEVPLERELELLDRYLAIEQARLGPRLRVVRDIAPSAAGALVPTFVLQPIVENAIRHGIEPRLAPGTVTIGARRNGERLELTVQDDGVGLAGTSSPRHGRGIGLTNTEARLHALHGDGATLVINPPAAGGVVVRIVMPYSTTPRTAAVAGDPAARRGPPGRHASAGQPNPPSNPDLREKPASA